LIETAIYVKTVTKLSTSETRVVLVLDCVYNRNSNVHRRSFIVSIDGSCNGFLRSSFGLLRSSFGLLRSSFGLGIDISVCILKHSAHNLERRFAAKELFAHHGFTLSIVVASVANWELSCAQVLREALLC
jgi:hypothetical protein